MGRDDSESGADQVLRWLLPVGAACILAAVVGGSINAFGVELPAVGSVPRQLILGAVGVALIAPGIWLEAQRRRKVARRQLSSAEREQVRAHIDLLTKSLRQLILAPDVREFLIVDVDGVEGFYAQFTFSEGHLHGELVSTRFLRPLYHPAHNRLQLFREYGWKPPDAQVPNFHKDFGEHSRRHTRMVAQEIVDLFINVYGVAPDDPLHAHFGDGIHNP